MEHHSALTLAAYVTAIILFYAMISRGLFRATEDIRFSLIELSKPLLDSEAVSEREKKKINSALDDVHSALSAWKMVIALLMVVFLLPFSRRDESLMQRYPAGLRQNYTIFLNRWVVATLGNSPIAMLLFMTITVLVFAFITPFIPLAALILGRRSNQGDGHHQHA